MTITQTMHLPYFPFNKKRINTSDSIRPRIFRPVSAAERIADEIIHLYETYGTQPYKDAPVTKASHMVQCAMLAMESLHELPVIVGALLHDINHLIKHEPSTEDFGGYSIVKHAESGGAYLRSKGFSERICAMAEQQVAAKRYLIATDEAFKRKLSSASLQTLNGHGGPMSISETLAFEKHTYFADIINVCRWDEEAKSPTAALLPVTWFWKLICDHLYYRVA
jgi:putative nucleotidyltransferase with HDIG domain